MSDEKLNANQQDNKEENKQPTRKKYSEMTELERLNAKKRRDIMIKKKLQEVKEASPEERDEIFDRVHIDRVEDKPKTFKEKWANYWYHYKIATWVAVFVVGLTAFFIHDIATKVKYDVDIMMITATYYDYNWLETVETQLEELIEDYNDDGAKEVTIQNINIAEDTTGMDPNTVMANQVKFSVSASEGSNFLYILDQENYDVFIENDIILYDLSQIFDDENVDGDKYYLNDNPLFEQYKDESLILVIRDVDNIKKGDTEEKQEQFRNELELVKKIIEIQ